MSTRLKRRLVAGIWVIVVVCLGVVIGGDVVVKEGKIYVEGLDAIVERQDLVLNGSFDNELTDWEETGTWETGTDANGNYAEGEKNEILTQNIGVEADTLYQITLTYTISGGMIYVDITLGGNTERFDRTFYGTSIAYIRTSSP